MTGPDAVILAGGASRRMGGGDKGLRQLGASTVLGHVIDRVAPQVGRLAINANGGAARFAAYRLPVLGDPVTGLPGPLAGVLAAMDWCDGASVVTVAGDVPFVPRDLVGRLVAAARTTGAAVAASGGRWHGVCALWPVSARGPVAAALARGERRVGAVLGALSPGVAEWPVTAPDGFFNINTPDDLAAAERWLCSTPG